MGCNFIYKNGKLSEVVADNGKPSVLFQKAKKIFGEGKAKEIYYISKSDQFQDVFKASIEVYKQKIIKKINDVRFQVIGEKGAQNLDQIEEATFRMDNLLVAKEMEQAGKTPLEIKMATSWEKGVDSLWRYETPNIKFKNADQEIKIGEEYDSKDILVGDSVTAYPSVKIKFNENGTNLYNPIENIIELDARGVISTISERGYELMGEKGQELRPLLYRLSSMDTRSLEHEYTHYIQRQEGFSRGGSPLAIRVRAFELSGIKDEDSGDVRLEKIKNTLENTKDESDKKILQAVIDVATGVDTNAINKAYLNIAGEEIGVSEVNNPVIAFQKKQISTNDIRIEKQETKRGYSFVPVVNGEKAGAIRVSPHKEGYKVDEVVVYDRFQRNGIGTMLYKEAAKDLVSQGKSLYSLNTRTAFADNIWRSFVNSGVAKKLENDYKIEATPPNIDNNGEPTLNEVSNFAKNQEKTDRLLTLDEKVELLNFMASNSITNTEELKSKIKYAFYNDMGIFVIDVDKLVNSGLYSKANAKLLGFDIKPTIEALLNTDLNIQVLPVYGYQKNFEKTSFGNFRVTPPQYENNGNSQVLDNDLKVRENNNTKNKLLIASNNVKTKNSIRKIENILSKSDQVIEKNTDVVQQLLDEIVVDLSNYGIDLVGLDTSGNIKEFLGSLLDFIQIPNNENAEKFSQIYNNKFNIDTRPLTINLPNDKVYFKVDTNKTEQEVFESSSLIKQDNNIYYKVRRESIESLLSKLGMEGNVVELEKESRQQQGFTNPDIALEVLLYKKSFGTPLKVDVEIKSDVSNFSGNYDYLTSDFVVDFHVKMIKEKRANSKIYKNFYSLFDINEKGLFLKNEDSYSVSVVEMYADNNLRQYSQISKQLPNLKVEQMDITDDRSNIVNNKSSVAEYKGDAYKIDNDNFIAKEGKKFLKVDDSIFEAIQKDGELSLFSRVKEQESNYYQIAKQPLPNIDIKNYIHLKSKPNPFLSVNIKKETENIKKTNFDCL